jgi:hypothetical protein
MTNAGTITSSKRGFTTCSLHSHSRADQQPANERHVARYRLINTLRRDTLLTSQSLQTYITDISFSVPPTATSTSQSHSLHHLRLLTVSDCDFAVCLLAGARSPAHLPLFKHCHHHLLRFGPSSATLRLTAHYKTIAFSTLPLLTTSQ